MSVWYAMCLNSAPLFAGSQTPSAQVLRIECEVHAYLELFKLGGLQGKSVQTDIVVVGDDLDAAKRFARTSDFDQEVLYGTGAACIGRRFCAGCKGGNTVGSQQGL